MGINLRLFILTGTLLLVQLSQQAAVPEAVDASEMAFPDGEGGSPRTSIRRIRSVRLRGVRLPLLLVPMFLRGVRGLLGRGLCGRRDRRVSVLPVRRVRGRGVRLRDKVAR